LALRALAWLLYSSVPLNLKLLGSAASIDPNVPFTDDQLLDDDTSILETCRSLIYVQPTTNVVAVCHLSVTQFLQSRKMPDGRKNKYYLDEHESHSRLMRSCFMYLSWTSFTSPILFTLSSFEMGPKLSMKPRDRFIFCAIWNWVDHAKKLKHNENYWSYVYDFLKEGSLAAWSELWEIEVLRRHPWWEESKEDIAEHRWPEIVLCEIASARPGRCQVGGSLYYASRLGLLQIVEKCLEDEDPNNFGGPMSYPFLPHCAMGT